MLHALDGFFFIAHFFVNDAEVVDDVLFDVVHDRQFAGGVGKGLGGEVEHRTGCEALAEEAHRADTDAGVLAGFLKFGNRFLKLPLLDENFPQLEAHLEIGWVLFHTVAS